MDSCLLLSGTRFPTLKGKFVHMCNVCLLSTLYAVFVTTLQYLCKLSHCVDREVAIEREEVGGGGEEDSKITIVVGW